MLHSESSGLRADVPFTATTGVDELDRALNGLFWGDNVVFAADDAADVEPFFLAVAAKAALYEASAFVTLVREPAELEQTYPGLEIVDARAGQPAWRSRGRCSTRSPGVVPGRHGSSSCSTRSRR